MLTEDLFYEWEDYAVRNKREEIIGIQKDAPEKAKVAYQKYKKFMDDMEKKGIDM